MNYRDTFLFENHPQPIWIFTDASQKIIAVNKAAIDKYGYSRKEFLSLSLKNLFPALEKKKAADKQKVNLGNNDIQILKKNNGKFIYSRIIIHSMEYEGEKIKIAMSDDVSEQFSKKEILEISYNQLKYHITKCPLAVIEWDRDIKIKTWTDKAEAIFGYPESNVKGKDPLTLTQNIIRLEERTLVKNKVNELLKSDRTENNFEITVLDAYGKVKYTRWHNSVLKNDDNAIISILSFVEDITNQRLAEKELFTSQQLYKSLFDNSLDAIILIDNHMRIVDVNNATNQLLGYSFDELYMKSIQEIVPDDYKDEELSKWQDFIDDGKSEGEFRVQCKSGDIRIVEYKAVTDIMPGVHLSVLRDITQRKETESELKYQQAFMETAISSIPGLFYVADESGQLIRWNKNTERVLGYSPKELYNLNILDFYAPEERKKAIHKLQEIIAKGSASDEFRLIDKKGQILPYFVTGKHFRDLGHNYIVEMGIDISRRASAEEKIKKSLLEKEVLLTEIHHRVKNNLAVISGLLDLQKEITEDINAVTALNDSQLRVHSIAMIHEKLYQNDDLSDIKFDEYIKDLIQLISNSRTSPGKKIDVIYDTEELSINVNQAIPCGLIVNEIVNNALEHAFKEKDQGTIKITFKKISEEYLLEISDNGTGFPDDISSVSESLGLSLIRTLASQLKANIRLKNDNGVSYSLRFREN